MPVWRGRWLLECCRIETAQACTFCTALHPSPPLPLDAHFAHPDPLPLQVLAPGRSAASAMPAHLAVQAREDPQS